MKRRTFISGGAVSAAGWMAAGRMTLSANAGPGTTTVKCASGLVHGATFRNLNVTEPGGRKEPVFHFRSTAIDL